MVERTLSRELRIETLNAAVMSSSARTPGDETGRQLLHILNQYCGKLFVPATLTKIEYQQEEGGVGAAVWLASCSN